MKPEELIQAVQELSHESFEAPTWVRWFNEALQDLTPVLRLESYEEFTVTAADERDLPGDIYEVIRFKINSGGDDIDLTPVGIGETGDKRAYWIWDGTAYFPEIKTGTCKLWYYRRPAKFKIGSAAADIQDGYEDAIVLYAAAKSKAPDRWLDDKGDFFKDYLIRKQQINMERSRQLRRPRHGRVVSFTAGGRVR